MNECEDFACDDDDDGASSSFVCVDFVGRWALKSLYSCSPSRSSSYTQSLHGGWVCNVWLPFFYASFIQPNLVFALTQQHG